MATTLTRRENLRLALSGQTPQWVPCSLNFKQWFDHKVQTGSLPAKLRGVTDYIEAMRRLDCDIFTRNVNAGVNMVDRTTPMQRDRQKNAMGIRTALRYDTPHGPLHAVIQQQADLATDHQEEHFVKDWSRDGAAFMHVLDQIAYEFDEAHYESLNRRVGDDGIVNVPCGTTPLKFLHIMFGLEYASMFMMDEPDAADEVCRRYWSKLWPVYERLARAPHVESAILMDNVDTPFYPPVLAQRYWTPYVKQAADLMASHNKHLFVHACGKLAGLSGEFAAAKVTGLEGISHPPLGDWPAHEAQKCHNRFVFIGGFSAHEQREPDDRKVRDFYRGYLGAAGKSRFIFSSSCQTAIQTTWERLELVRDICREWGGQPAPLRGPRS
jgi:hypothetical protein